MSYLDIKSATTPYTNGKHLYIQEVDEEYGSSCCDSFMENVKRLWRRPTLNEWTCTLMMFLFSTSIIIGKLYLNYDLASQGIIEPFIKYSWLINAVFSGLITTGISWFMIYKDSSIPGVNPPSPFTPSKKRPFSEPSMPDMNYFVGGLIGVLMFLYKCL